MGGGGGLESKLSDQLWLSFSLALAKPNKIGKGRPKYAREYQHPKGHPERMLNENYF